MSESYHHKRATRLAEKTENLLAMAFHEIGNGPINWGDLHCAGAVSGVNDDGEQVCVVWIEEASPEAHELRDYVYDGLVADGWDGVEVILEW